MQHKLLLILFLLGCCSCTKEYTFFIASQDYTVNNWGASWMQEFTLSTRTSFVLRFASRYKAQAAILVPGQIDNFKNNKAFSGYAVFNDQIGTNYITLSPGTYYAAIRNTSSSANKWSIELDATLQLPVFHHGRSNDQSRSSHFLSYPYRPADAIP